LLGYDPRLQVIHEDDAVSALAGVIDRPTPGTFNVAATGQLYLSRILRLGRRVPQPLPKRGFESALRGLARIGLALPRHVASLLKHGRVMDVSEMIEPLGFRPGYNSRQTALATYGRLPATREDEPRA
jgi:UDP-glucose 4-epimerase